LRYGMCCSVDGDFFLAWSFSITSVSAEREVLMYLASVRRVP